MTSKCKNKCKTDTYNLFYDDFSNGFAPSTPDSPYNYFFGLADAAGGVTVAPNNVTINSSPFTFTSPFIIDDFKYAVISKNYYNAPLQGELVFETIMSSQQTGLEGLPDYLKAIDGGVTGVNDVNSDFRLSCGIFALFDLKSTWLTLAFTVTNEDVYIDYGVTDAGKPEWGGTDPDYNAFANIIPVAKRNVADPLNDYTKLAIAYNYGENYIRYLVNDIEVYRVNRLGYPLERKYAGINYNNPGQLNPPSKMVRPTELTFVFGNTSGMSYYNPHNPSNLQNAALVPLLSFLGTTPYSDPNVTNVDGTNKPATFLASYNQEGMNGTLFGQGNNVSYKYFSVYLNAQKEKVGILKGLHCCKENVLLTVCDQDKINGVNASTNVSEYKCKGCIENCNPCLLGNKCECYSSSSD